MSQRLLFSKKPAIEALASTVLDGRCRAILAATMARPKSAEELSGECSIPLVSCYRKLRDLIERDVLVVERIVISGDGRRFALYRSSFSSLEFLLENGELTVEARLNPGVLGKLRARSLLWTVAESRSILEGALLVS